MFKILKTKKSTRILKIRTLYRRSKMSSNNSSRKKKSKTWRLSSNSKPQEPKLTTKVKPLNRRRWLLRVIRHAMA